MAQKTIVEILRWIPIGQMILISLLLAWGIILYTRRRHQLWLRRLPVVLWFAQLITILTQSFFSWLYLRGTEYPQVYLPPHSTFLLRHITYALTEYLASWIAATILLILLWYIFIRRTHGEFLDNEDVLLVVVGAIAVGWPAIFVFLGVVFLLSVLGILIQVIFRRKTISGRLVITPYILPAAILTYIFRFPLLEFTGLITIRF